MPCYNSIIVNAPIERVWEVIRDFHRMDWGKPFVTSCNAVGEISGDQLGAKRVLNGAFEETLQELDEPRYRIAYSIDNGPEPVSRETVRNYVGAIKLLPVTSDDTTFVQWTSEYESEDSQLVSDFCNPIYAALLASLRDYFS